MEPAPHLTFTGSHGVHPNLKSELAFTGSHGVHPNLKSELAFHRVPWASLNFIFKLGSTDLFPISFSNWPSTGSSQFENRIHVPHDVSNFDLKLRGHGSGDQPPGSTHICPSTGSPQFQNGIAPPPGPPNFKTELVTPTPDLVTCPRVHGTHTNLKSKLPLHRPSPISEQNSRLA